MLTEAQVMAISQAVSQSVSQALLALITESQAESQAGSQAESQAVSGTTIDDYVGSQALHDKKSQAGSQCQALTKGSGYQVQCKRQAVNNTSFCGNHKHTTKKAGSQAESQAVSQAKRQSTTFKSVILRKHGNLHIKRLANKMTEKCHVVGDTIKLNANISNKRIMTDLTDNYDFSSWSESQAKIDNHSVFFGTDKSGRKWRYIAGKYADNQQKARKEIALIAVK